MNIDMNHITMIYPSGKKALQDISMHAESPGFIGILGPNGAGKTTLMKLLIAGLLPTKGGILLNGRPLLCQEKQLKAQLGYLPQSFGMYDELTVWQFLDYMAALKGVKGKAALEDVLERTNLTKHKKVRIRNLSGGQRQRAGIAQALLGDPELLILDEPTVGLDPEERVKFRNIFSEMSQNKIILLSTHIVEDVQAVCSRVLVIYDGRILYDGTPSALIRETVGHVGVYVSQTPETAGWNIASVPETAGRDITFKPEMQETGRNIVSVPEMQEAGQNCQIVSKVSVSGGVQCRIVAKELPENAMPVEPTLEDAYLYCIHKKDMDNETAFWDQEGEVR